MRTKSLWISLFVSMLVINAAPDDDFLHPDRNSLTVSDTVLSGIDFYHNTIEDVIAKLGKPDIFLLRPSSETTVAMHTYEWLRKKCRLRVVVVEGHGRSMISSIDLWGTGPDAELGTTGRGLKLGDSISDARRIYGLSLHFGVTLSEKGLLRSSDGCALTPTPTLGVDFDETGTINHMRMSHGTFCY